MSIVMKKQAAVPDGEHRGIIVEAIETKTDFGAGPEDTVRITVAPEWQADERTETLPLAVNFTPSLNGLSGLSRLLGRLGITVDEGKEFKPQTLEGMEILFTARKNAKNFTQIDKETMRRAPAKTTKK